MMLLRDIPDKLAVTAFVYQMFNYFTMAVPSAIIKPTGNTKDDDSKPVPSPLSGLTGFDFTEIEKLTCKNLSPTATEDSASKRNIAGNKWSKHNLKEERELMEQQRSREDETCNHGDTEGVVHTPEKHEGNAEPVSHSTPVSGSVTRESVESSKNTSTESSHINTKPTVSCHKTTPTDDESSNSPLPAKSSPSLSHKITPQTTPPDEGLVNGSTAINDSSSCLPLPARSNLSLQLSSVTDISSDSRISFPDLSSDVSAIIILFAQLITCLNRPTLLMKGHLTISSIKGVIIINYTCIQRSPL